jgi:hypothetical protein
MLSSAGELLCRSWFIPFQETKCWSLDLGQYGTIGEGPLNGSVSSKGSLSENFVDRWRDVSTPKGLDEEQLDRAYNVQRRAT